MTSKKSAIGLIPLLTIFATVSVLSIASIGGTSYVQAIDLMDQVTDIAEVKLPAIRTMTLIDMHHDAVRGAVMTAIVAGEEKDQKEVETVKKELIELKLTFQKELDELAHAHLRNDTIAEIGKVRPEIFAYADLAIEIATQVEQGTLPLAKSNLVNFTKTFESLEASLEILGDKIERNVKEDINLGHTATVVILVISIACTVLGLIFAVFVISRLKKVLAVFASQISAQGLSLSETSQALIENNSTLSNNSNMTASSIEETSASLEELTATVRSNASSSEEGARLSDECRSVAKQSGEKILRLIDKIEEVASSSRKMLEITEVIDELAFQTNLLALNAAIEAARAGDHGRGFAIVAEAVRMLATKSSQAAGEIGVLIKGAVQSIQEGSGVASESREALKEILTVTEQLSVLSVRIAASSKEQLSGLTQISGAVNQIDQGAQRNASVAEELSNSSEQLNQKSTDLHHLVNSFKTEIGISTKLAANNTAKINHVNSDLATDSKQSKAA